MATVGTFTGRLGLPGLRLENQMLRLDLLPGAGGKMVSLLDRLTGREWLWSNPHLDAAEPVYGADYGAVLDSGGWDEILPSVAPCTIRLGEATVAVPDHGELVGLGWEIEEFGLTPDGGAVCGLVARGRALPVTLARRIRLDALASRIELDYTMENTGAEPWSYLCCPHPLFDAFEGLRIGLPQGLPLRLESMNGAQCAAEGEWPVLQLADGSLTDAGRALAAPAAAFAAKLFVESPASGCVQLHDDANGTRLELVFERADFPWLGLWINNGGWSGCGSAPYRNLGVEPSSAACDSLPEAIARGEARVLAPGARAQWRLTVALHGPHDDARS